MWQDEPDSEDEDKYADRADMPGQKFDTKRWALYMNFESLGKKDLNSTNLAKNGNKSF